MYTTDKIIMHHYEKFLKNYPDYCKLVREDRYSMTFSIDPKCMGFYPKAPRKGPELTDEQKKANSDRLKRLKERKRTD